jgi:arabinogalactan endo-1,4-beta-galactosidase
MKRWMNLALILALSQAAFSQAWKGVDASFLPEMLSNGVAYLDEEGTEIEFPRQWMAEKGVDLVRLRVWHNPSTGLRSSWLEVLEEAKRWDSLGVSLLIDYHFSDTWADPAHQEIPAAWSGESFEEAQGSMTCWLECTLGALLSNGIEPAIVQLGNEIDPGLMLPHGGVNDGFGALAELLNAGHDVVGEVFPDCQVAIHVSSLEIAPWFFGLLSEAGYVPDVAAVSQYSKWHLQEIEGISDAVLDLYETTGIPVFIAETAYAWTASWADWTDNLWWTGDETPGYPFTPEGQLAYFEALQTALNQLEPGACLGWCYWAPDWVASLGETSTEGSNWENAALFDFDWKALPAWGVFDNP